MASTHSRKTSIRSPLPRRNTRGPLQADDPLSGTPENYSPATPAPPLLGGPSETIAVPQKARSHPEVPPVSDEAPVHAADIEEKDLSFLLDASIYQNLDQAEVPSAFRKNLPQAVSSDTTLTRIFTELDRRLSECDFYGAAYLAANTLTSGVVRPTDTKDIFQLLAIRFSCLELCGQTIIAAQESKALEDLTSTFYYLEQPELGDEDAPDRHPPVHIVPFSLRLQALRLQSIGFSDPRRGVTALYDLGMECRQHIASSSTSDEQREVWRRRLSELGIRVVNALIEMGELDCAERTLGTTQPGSNADSDLWTLRKALLLIRMGKTSKAKRLLEGCPLDAGQSKLLVETVMLMAEGEYGPAAELLSKASEQYPGNKSTALLKQNLAVAELYNGNLLTAKTILENLVDENESFQTLTINLATVYDLSSDHSRDLKLSLADRIAQQQEQKSTRTFTNADFKL